MIVIFPSFSKLTDISISLKQSCGYSSMMNWSRSHMISENQFVIELEVCFDIYHNRVKLLDQNRRNIPLLACIEFSTIITNHWSAFKSNNVILSFMTLNFSDFLGIVECYQLIWKRNAVIESAA